MNTIKKTTENMGFAIDSGQFRREEECFISFNHFIHFNIKVSWGVKKGLSG